MDRISFIKRLEEVGFEIYYNDNIYNHWMLAVHSRLNCNLIINTKNPIFTLEGNPLQEEPCIYSFDELEQFLEGIE